MRIPLLGFRLLENMDLYIVVPIPSKIYFRQYQIYGCTWERHESFFPKFEIWVNNRVDWAL